MIKKEDIKHLKKVYEKDTLRTLRQRMLSKVPLVDLVQDADTQLTETFNINIETHSVTDQKATGRCWSFAGLNILREKVIQKCKLDSFELSGSYIAFYDKLERFHVLQERICQYQKEGRDVYDRSVSLLLERGITDGAILHNSQPSLPSMASFPVMFFQSIIPLPIPMKSMKFSLDCFESFI